MSGKALVRVIVFLLLIAGVCAFFFLGGQRLLSLQFLVTQKEALKTYVQTSPAYSVGAYILAYLVLGGLCLPGATVLHISGGVLFGFRSGLLLVCLASTCGTILGFLTSRFLLRDLIARHAGGKLREIEQGIAHEGGLFIFALRLIPVIPSSTTNMILGICPISFVTYVWVSFVASLPRYVLYVLTGAQLDRIRSVDDIVSPGLLAAMATLGVLPLVLKHSWSLMKPWLKSRLHL